MARYREYLHNQVRELLTVYGEISYLFYDFSYPERQILRSATTRARTTGARSS